MYVAFVGFFAVNSSPAGVLYRPILWPPPPLWVMGQCRFVGSRIPRMYVGIHRLFLCKFSPRWGALPLHSLASACAVGSRVNVASLTYESREYAWAFSGSSSVSSPSAGVLYRPIHWSLSCHICFLGGIVFSVQKRLCQRRAASFAEPNPRREPMSFRGPTNPANARGRSLAFPLSILPPLESFAASFAGLRPRRGFAGGGYLVGLRIPRMYVCKFLNFPAWMLAPVIKLCLPIGFTFATLSAGCVKAIHRRFYGYYRGKS